jgi:hypothetical protein
MTFGHIDISSTASKPQNFDGSIRQGKPHRTNDPSELHKRMKAR